MTTIMGTPEEENNEFDDIFIEDMEINDFLEDSQPADDFVDEEDITLGEASDDDDFDYEVDFKRDPDDLDPDAVEYDAEREEEIARTDPEVPLGVERNGPNGPIVEDHPIVDDYVPDQEYDDDAAYLTDEEEEEDSRTFLQKVKDAFDGIPDGR